LIENPGRGVIQSRFERIVAEVLPENFDILLRGVCHGVGEKALRKFKSLNYAMNLPTSVVITGCDSMQILDQALDAARNFRRMEADAVKALLAKTAQAAMRGKFELYKTTHHFDGTYQNPQWLG
jgi:ABC-type branched-subunit amino acid transport system substrate-binding protein